MNVDVTVCQMTAAVINRVSVCERDGCLSL